MHKYFKIMLLLLLLLVALVILYYNHPIVKSIIFNFPSQSDKEMFKKEYIYPASTPYRFKNSSKQLNYGETIILDDWYKEDASKKKLKDFVEMHNTNAILIVKDDIIVYEQYGEDFDKNSFFTSYSLSKSFLSVLIGIAIEEGDINNVNEVITCYLPSLKNKSKFENVKISHLLNHTSGIKTNFITDAYMYYGRNIENVIEKLSIEREPGTFQKYQNINALLLGMILTNATGMNNAKYLEKKIWKKIGTESEAYWSTYEDSTYQKSFCCINAKIEDFAKFGRLMLNRGYWNEEKVIPESWIDDILKRDTSGGSSWAYNKSWYMGLELYGDFMAIGLYKQFIYISPYKNVVIVRLGEREPKLKEEKARWARVFREIVDQL